jgi:ketosteroid isomerase-like protein
MTENRGETELEIMTLAEELRQAEMRVDVEALERFYAEDIMVTAPVGIVVDKPLVREELRRAATAEVEVYDKDDYRVRVYGDVAVASYRLTIKGQHEGIEINQQFRITDAWLRREGSWQVISRHTAVMAPPQASVASN